MVADSAHASWPASLHSIVYTARAHEMRTTHDWVVIYRDDHGGHGQWTVITSTMGKLTGRRIVRGREAECRAFHGVKKTRKVASGI